MAKQSWDHGFHARISLGPRYHYPAQLLDAQRAMRYMRSHSFEYHLDPGRIGIWGFSAGGYLAAVTSTNFDDGNPTAPEGIDRASSRPDFMNLSYPVIDPLGSAAERSFQNLLGKNPSPTQIEEVSPDLHVTKQRPSAFLVHSDDDEGVWLRGMGML
jgi:acetyl esterase/lipase